MIPGCCRESSLQLKEMKLTRRTLLFPLLLLGWIKALPVHARLWEVKTPKGGSYVPPRPAISLQDHNTVFSTSAYCVFTLDNDTSTSPSTAYGLSRALCDECSSCTWKQRPGFTTEGEWQTAVTAEMDRLMGSTDLGDTGGGHQQVIGSWIAEVADDMDIDVDMLDKISFSLGVTLKNLAVSPASAETPQRRFFVVSGTPSTVEGMLAAGFVSITPIPPRLKLHPMLEEEGWHNGLLYARLATPPAPSSSFLSTTHLNVSHELLLPPWTPAAAAAQHRGSLAASGRAGHRQVEETIAEGGNKLTIGGVGSREEAYAAALDVAMHGQVHWVGPKPPLTASNYFASKVAQAWPPEPLNRSPAGKFWGGSFNIDIDDIPRRWRNWYQHQQEGGEQDLAGEGEENKIWPMSPAPLYDIGLTGEGEVVGVADVGCMDYYSCFFEDENENLSFRTAQKRGGRMYDIFESKTHRKIRQYVIGHDKGFRGSGGDMRREHGTMTVSSAVGNPTGSYWVEDTEKSYEQITSTGSALFAKVAYFELPPEPWCGANDKQTEKKKTAVEKVCDKLKKSKKPSYDGFMDFKKHVLPHAYDVGARVYSLSIGHRGTGEYGMVAGPVDEFCHEHQDFILLAAAGNFGEDDERDKQGRGPNDIVEFPAGAKNAVAVGSHRNLGFGPNKLQGRPDRLSAFQLRGPSNDGRIKPDVCGPGEDVRTAYTTRTLGKGGTRTCETEYAFGTSLSTPILAGITVLARQYFTMGYYPDGKEARPDNAFTPMGALLKALLVNSGRQLYEYKDNRQQEAVPLPNKDMGWGGVDMSTTLVTPSSPPGQALKVFGEWSKECKDCPQLRGGDSCEYSFQVTPPPPPKIDPVTKKEIKVLLPLKVTLVWYDHPSEPTAKQFMVNNLDLSITSPDSPDSVYPNGGNSPDTINHVEHITIQSPTPGGRYTVKVDAGDVAMAPQPFALVISGPFKRDGMEVIYASGNKKNKKVRGKHVMGHCGGDGSGGGGGGKQGRHKKKHSKRNINKSS